MNVLILNILSFLIGILLFKLLYNRECFINISNDLILITEKFCDDKPNPIPPLNPIYDHIRKSDTFLNVIYMNNTSQDYNWWWCLEDGSNTITKGKNDAYGCFLNEFYKIIDSDYNVIILTFYINTENCSGNGDDGCMDMIGFWNTMTLENRTKLVKLLNDNNIAILGSFGGATVNGVDVDENCCLANCDPVGTQCCMFPYNHFINNINTELNGIDIDLEGFKAGGVVSKCMNNLNELITQIKQKFADNGNLNPLITGAPQTPHFRNTNPFSINFTQYEINNPTDFDFYNIQFYNQNGQNNYNTLFLPSNEDPPNIDWLIESGIPEKKIVLGKCSYPECHNNEHMNDGDYNTYSQLFEFINNYETYKDKKIKGIMYWQLYPKPEHNLIDDAKEYAGNYKDGIWENPGINGYDWLKT